MSPTTDAMSAWQRVPSNSRAETLAKALLPTYASYAHQTSDEISEEQTLWNDHATICGKIYDLLRDANLPIVRCTPISLFNFALHLPRTHPDSTHPHAWRHRLTAARRDTGPAKCINVIIAWRPFSYEVGEWYGVHAVEQDLAQASVVIVRLAGDAKNVAVVPPDWGRRFPDGAADEEGFWSYHEELPEFPFMIPLEKLPEAMANILQMAKEGKASTYHVPGTSKTIGNWKIRKTATAKATLLDGGVVPDFGE